MTAARQPHSDQTIRRVLENIAITTANAYGGFEGFDPGDIEDLDDATAALTVYVEERLLQFYKSPLGEQQSTIRAIKTKHKLKEWQWPTDGKLKEQL